MSLSFKMSIYSGMQETNFFQCWAPQKMCLITFTYIAWAKCKIGFIVLFEIKLKVFHHVRLYFCNKTVRLNLYILYSWFQICKKTFLSVCYISSMLIMIPSLVKSFNTYEAQSLFFLELNWCSKNNFKTGSFS